MPSAALSRSLDSDVIDQHELAKNVAKEDWLPTCCYMSEWSFQWLDYITRTTGLLTKSVRFVETEGLFYVQTISRDAQA
jgi:hypothetical protein